MSRPRKNTKFIDPRYFMDEKMEEGRYGKQLGQWAGAGNDPEWSEEHHVWNTISQHTGFAFVRDWLDAELRHWQYMGPEKAPGAVWTKGAGGPFETSDHEINKDSRKTGFHVGEVYGSPGSIMKMPNGDHYLVTAGTAGWTDR